MTVDNNKSIIFASISTVEKLLNMASSRNQHIIQGGKTGKNTCFLYTIGIAQTHPSKTEFIALDVCINNDDAANTVSMFNSFGK